MLKTTTTQIHQNLQPHTHASFQRRTSASDTPLPAHIRTNLRAIFRGLTEPWDFQITMDLKNLSSMMRKDCKGSGSAGVKKNLAKCIPTVAKICSQKKDLWDVKSGAGDKKVQRSISPLSGGFTSKGQVRRLPPQMSRISDYA